MNSMEHTNALTETAMKIFEEAAFALIDGVEREEEREKQEQIATKVSFQGPKTGTLYVKLDTQLAVMFAENMLGLDPGDPDAVNKGADALKELANMICGNLLPVVYGVEKEFKVLAPVEMPLDDYDAVLKTSGAHEALIVVEGLEANLLMIED